MSIHYDTEKDQEGAQQASPVIQDRQLQPAPPFPPPSHSPPRARRNLWILVGALALTFALLASLGLFFVPALLQHPGGTPATPTLPAPVTPTALVATPTTPAITPTPTAPVVIPTPAPGIVLGPQACPASVSSPAYWNAIIGTIAEKRQVESISCANLLGTPSLQAMVLVRYIADGTLDVYGFDHLSTHPTRLFLLPALAAGDARISGYNTILTAEADQSPAAPDLFREFQWSASKGGLVQVAFPGIFPDLTRYQAEADQARVNAGKDSWKKDAKQVALRFVRAFVDWKVPATAQITSGGGPFDVEATVRVRAEIAGMPVAQRPYLTVALSRLEGNVHTMWVAIALNRGSPLLTTVQARSLIASPVKLAGSGSPFEGDIGEAYILDHRYSGVGQAHLTVPPGWGPRAGPYSVLVGYELSFKQGPQEGVVEVEQTNPSGLGSFAVVMIKVLLNPQARLVQGPVFCPVASLAALGSDSLTARCAQLKGNASLQALLPEGGRFVLYDQVVTAHPAPIWSIQSLNAQISEVSTLITDDSVADAHFYREFRWSARASAFVQVAFPGMYPDMTRWQAEERQRQVIVGEISRVGAVDTAIALIGGAGKLVRGGGSRDLTASVDVTYPPREASLPVTRVALSRLGGNTSGIWEVTAVGSDWLTISAPGSGATVASPLLVRGYGPQFERQIGSVFLLDQQYRQIQEGENIAWAPGNTSPPSPFSCELTYSTGFHNGAQEGLVKLVHTSGSSSNYGVVLVKVLLGA